MKGLHVTGVTNFHNGNIKGIDVNGYKNNQQFS